MTGLKSCRPGDWGRWLVRTISDFHPVTVAAKAANKTAFNQKRKAVSNQECQIVPEYR